MPADGEAWRAEYARRYVDGFLLSSRAAFWGPSQAALRRQDEVTVAAPQQGDLLVAIGTALVETTEAIVGVATELTVMMWRTAS